MAVVTLFFGPLQCVSLLVDHVAQPVEAHLDAVRVRIGRDWTERRPGTDLEAGDGQHHLEFCLADARAATQAWNLVTVALAEPEGLVVGAAPMRLLAVAASP